MKRPAEAALKWWHSNRALTEWSGACEDQRAEQQCKGHEVGKGASLSNREKDDVLRGQWGMGGAEEMRSEGWHQAVYEEGPCDNEELEFFRGQGETTKKSFKKRNGRVWYMLLKRSLTPNSCLDHPSLTHPRGWHNLINKTSDRAQRGEKAHRTDPSPNKSPSCWFSSPEICVVLSFFFVFLNSWLNLMFPPNPNLQGV